MTAIPHNVRSIAKRAYHLALIAGRTLSHSGDYFASVDLHDGKVTVGKGESRWTVPIAASWL